MDAFACTLACMLPQELGLSPTSLVAPNIWRKRVTLRQALFLGMFVGTSAYGRLLLVERATEHN